MDDLNFKKTISLAVNIYKKSFKITFILAFILSFISEYCFIYMMQHGIAEYIQSGGKSVPANIPSTNILGLMVLVIILATVFVYAMTILLQSLFIKHELKISEALKISFQVFATRKIFSFFGAFLLSIILMTTLSLFLQYIGMYFAILLFLTVMPAILLEKVGIFDAICSNFKIIKDNCFYMFKLAFIVLVFMMVKPVLTLGLLILLKNFGVEMGSLESSIQNIVTIVLDSLIVPGMLAISVAAFLDANENKNLLSKD